MAYIRILSKRNKEDEIPSDLLVIDIDRTNPLLGNPFPMKNKDDDAEREQVIQAFKAFFDKQMQTDTLLQRAVMDLVKVYKSGRSIGLRCWCHPKPCHGDVIKNAIEKLSGTESMALEKLPPPDSLVNAVPDKNVPAAPAQKLQGGNQKPVPSFMQQRWKAEEIDYIECRFVVYVPDHLKIGRDWHMVKEIVHLKNGEVHPNVRWFPDYKTTGYVTHERFRKSHKQKKEHETLDKLITVKAPVRSINFEMARALGNWRLAENPRNLKNSPYVYGLDVPSTVDLKYKYTKRMEGKKETPFNVAYSDTETDMTQLLHPVRKYIIMQSIFYNGELHTFIVKDFLRNIHDPAKELREKYEQYMPEQGKPEVKKWEFHFVDKPIDVVRGIIDKAHELQPDFLSFWNMIFDWDKMVEVVVDDAWQMNPNLTEKEANKAVADFFCQRDLPPELKHYYIKRAKPSKTSASGRQMSKKPAEQWHSIHMAMPFYVIDQMATYRFVRKSKQTDKEFNLDYILNKELKGLSKLKFAQADGLTKGEFHTFLQKNYPIEYTIYHAWDAVCMKLLTDKTQDLTYSMPGSTGFSDFQSYESEPKRYVHDFHYFALTKHNNVTGVLGDSLVQEYDDYTISTKGHIITLEPHLTLDNGLCIFKDYPELRTYVRGHSGDLDVKGSYPYGQWVFNMSRMTTVRELIEIHGVRDHVRRIQGLNISGGPTNALEFTTQIFEMPSCADLSRIYDEEMAKQVA